MHFVCSQQYQLVSWSPAIQAASNAYVISPGRFFCTSNDIAFRKEESTDFNLYKQTETTAQQLVC